MDWCKLQNDNPVLSSVLSEWNDMLQQDLPERDYHSFLKENSGLFLVNGVDSYLAISKLKLGSRLETDFAIPYENHSVGLQWDLIEIKTPNVAPYNSSGNPSAKLTEAIQQVQDWRAWLSDNRREASKLFQSNGIRVSRDPHFKFTIVIGTRKNSEKYLSKRNSLARSLGIEIRSFDYLTDRFCKRPFLSRVTLGSGDWDIHHNEERAMLANPFYQALTDSTWKKLLEEPEVSMPHFTASAVENLFKYLKINKHRYNDFISWAHQA